MILRSIAALVLVLAASCSSGTAPRVGLQLELERARWARNGPTSYQVTVRRSCECDPAMAGPVVVTVRNGVVESRRYVASGDTVPSGLAGEFPSVEEMFTFVAQVQRQRPARLDVTYDHATGFPTRVSIDYNATFVDDESTYEMTDLTGR